MIEFGNALRSSWQAMSFLLKLVGTLKSDGLEIGWIDKNNALSAGVSGAPLIALEKRRERFIRTPDRAHNRIRSPTLAASWSFEHSR